MPRKPKRKTFNFHLRNGGSSQGNSEENTPDQESRTSPGQKTQSLARPTRAAKEKCLQNLSVIISKERSYDLIVKQERSLLRSLRVATESSEEREQRLEDLRQRASQRIACENDEQRRQRLEDMRRRASQRYSKSNTGAQDPLEFEPVCCFCGQFSDDCVAVSDHMPYLAGHKTTLAINHICIELDFSNDSLSKTVCRHCDTKLNEIWEFMKQVNTAQFSLVTVSQNVNNEIVKVDFHDKDDIDALTVTEEEYAKKTTIKRRSDDKGKNTIKKKAKIEVHNEFIMDIDIKEELSDDLKDNGLPEYSDVETDVKPSEAELANSALVYRVYETSDSDLCNLTKNSGNSEIGKSVIDRGLSEKT